jgi:hypothetical protein
LHRLIAKPRPAPFLSPPLGRRARVSAPLWIVLAAVLGACGEVPLTNRSAPRRKTFESVDESPFTFRIMILTHPFSPVMVPGGIGACRASSSRSAEGPAIPGWTNIENA